MNGATVLLTAIGYVSFLFLIAWWATAPGGAFYPGARGPFVYALSLAVYCTSWTALLRVRSRAPDGSRRASS